MKCTCDAYHGPQKCKQKWRNESTGRQRIASRLPIGLRFGLAIMILSVLAMAGMLPHTGASSSSFKPEPAGGAGAPASLAAGATAGAGSRGAGPRVRASAGDTCAAATVINPAALPFFDEGTNV